MEIKTTYVGTINGINGIWCGFKPEGAVIAEERQVLYPDENKVLINNNDEEFSAVWLKDGLNIEDFYEKEVEIDNIANGGVDTLI